MIEIKEKVLEEMYKNYDTPILERIWKKNDVMLLSETIDQTLAKVRKEIKKSPIDEICQCGHSKKAHSPHELDEHGGRCGICIHCSIYTWKEFIFNKELLNKIGRKERGAEDD